MKACWIDTNGCAETFHEFTRNEDGHLQVFHSSGDACEATEYNFKYVAPIEDLKEMGRLAKERF